MLIGRRFPFNRTPSHNRCRKGARLQLQGQCATIGITIGIDGCLVGVLFEDGERIDTEVLCEGQYVGYGGNNVLMVSNLGRKPIRTEAFVVEPSAKLFEFCFELLLE